MVDRIVVTRIPMVSVKSDHVGWYLIIQSQENADDESVHLSLAWSDVKNGATYEAVVSRADLLRAIGAA